MKQVLTQQEIDTLLNAMSTGAIDEELIDESSLDQSKIKTYDFRRPTKLSKEYINTLYMIFEDFSKIAGNALSTQVRTNVQMQIASIEQISYDEFIHSIPKFTLLGLFQSKPLNGIQMIEINPQLCMQIVELLCGGADAQLVEDGNFKKKSFTEIELAILEEIVKTFIQSYNLAWQELVTLNSEFEGLDTNPQLIQNMSPNEPVLLITLTVKIFKSSTFVNLCIPYVFFEGIIDKLSFRNWFDSEREFNQQDNDQLVKSLETVELDLQALLGKTTMKLSDFLHLEVGDIIDLDKKITEPLEMSIEERPYYLVKPGVKNNKMSVELLEHTEGAME